MTEQAGRVRAALIRHIVSDGFAPSQSLLCRELELEPSELIRSYRDLHDAHILVLHPHSNEIWKLHPFSMSPTAVWVQTRRMGWWCNCVWCALGLASALAEDVTITTMVGSEREQIEIRVADGEVTSPDWLVHLAVPAVRWWDNVVYTCSTINVFRRIDELEDWSTRHSIPIGEILTLETLWDLSKEWYYGYMEPDWKRKSPDEAKAVFDSCGLTSAFWSLDNRFR